MLGIILGPPSNQVACTPHKTTATHLVAAQNTASGTPDIISIPLSDAIAETGSWQQLIEIPEVASGGFTFDLENRLLFVAKSSTNGGIWKINMDGSGVPEKILDHPVNGGGITCNPVAQKVYYRRGSTDFPNVNTLFEIGYDGTGGGQVSSSVVTNHPWYDEENDWIYVQDASNDVIRRVRSDGTDEEVWKDPADCPANGQIHGDGTLGKLFRFDQGGGTGSSGLYETDIATKVDTRLMNGGLGIVYDRGTDKVFLQPGGLAANLVVWDRDTQTGSAGQQLPSAHYDFLGLAIID